MITNTEVVRSFTSPELHSAQRDHPVWKKVIYSLESCDETNLPELPVPFRQFILSEDALLCRSWPTKPVPAEQLVIPDKYTPVKLQLVYDKPLAGHPGRDKTLSVTRQKYYWSTLRLDVKDMSRAASSVVSTRGPSRDHPPCGNVWYQGRHGN